ncbi:MAG: 30S ribosomal protein S6 [Patescibacteria group bacterium]|nr:30S ribosomal protein S6 [Patescibacteria group bacterium]
MTETAKTAGTVYEVGYHIVPTVSPENLPREVDAVKAALEKVGATMIAEEAPKLRPLAYTMIQAVGSARHRFDTAHFGWIKFEAPREAVAELDKAMKANDKVLRYIIVKTVRENTLYGSKVLAEERRDSRDEAKSDAKSDTDGQKVAEPKAVKPHATEEEIDKSIDKLVG